MLITLNETVQKLMFITFATQTACYTNAHLTAKKALRFFAMFCGGNAKIIRQHVARQSWLFPETSQSICLLIHTLKNIRTVALNS